MADFEVRSREAILHDYKVEGGVILSPGKFEGEMLYVPYFYSLMLDGESIQVTRDIAGFPDECLDTFELEKRDFEIFPELTAQGYKVGDTISFTEDDVGFYTECRKVIRVVNGEIISEEEV